MRKHIISSILAAAFVLTACAANAATAIPTFTPAAPPVSPADLGLSGRLIYTGAAQSIAQVDLSTNQVSSLFDAPRNAFVTGEAVSPDGSQVVFSYAPPPNGSAQLGFSDLYQMPLQKTAEPAPLRIGSDKQEVYAYPAWSPDGKYLYYSHTLAARADGSSDGPRIERIVYPDGDPEIIQPGAAYPRLSRDGTMLVYITFLPDLSGNAVMIADPDGSRARKVVPEAGFGAIDSPVFSPDGKTILFSAVESVPTSSDRPDFWLDWLDVRVASAHNVPSDLWRVPSEGGTPQRLTHIGCTGLFPSYSPDGRHIAFVCDAGFFIMDSDGSNLGLINPVGGLGMMEWIP